MLSHPVPIAALVSHYLTNKLIGRGPIPRRNRTFGPETLSGITDSFPSLSQTQGQVTHALLSFSPLASAPKGLLPHDLHA